MRELQALLTVTDLARLLAVSRAHVYRLRDAGLLPEPYVIGRGLRWDPALIDLWLKNGCQRTTTRRPRGSGRRNHA